MEKLTFQSTKRLNNKVRIPLMGFGVAEIAEDLKTQVRILREAIEVGYRLFDTAQIYRSERAVGIAIKESGIPREEFFISSKIFDEQKYDRTTESFEESLRKMGIDYIDRFVLHWPLPGHYIQSWKELEKIHRSGRARCISVSNFEIWHMRNLLPNCEIIPATNQIEFNPTYMANEQREFCENWGVAMEAYTPIGRYGRFADNEILNRVGERHGKSVYQVLLRWDIQHNVIPVPRSSNQKHMAQNADIFDFELTSEDMAEIDSMNIDDRRNANPYNQL
ncbi:aldo/keto reductase [Massiliimalia massiliensis]|uniref:aldo/keto reductase n=1 Tax=Massiliimalia massiliensis TaxID=1852384 RepID=UPI000984D81E|nr:aldo/keto reductase [Massiliimalia massiliensis]